MGASITALPFPTAFTNLNEVANISQKGWIYTNTNAKTITTSYYWSFFSCPPVDTQLVQACVDSVLAELARNNTETREMILERFDAITKGFERAIQSAQAYPCADGLKSARECWLQSRPSSNTINHASLERQKKLLRSTSRQPAAHSNATLDLTQSTLFQRAQAKSKDWVVQPCRSKTVRATPRKALEPQGVLIDEDAKAQLRLRRKSLRPER